MSKMGVTHFVESKYKMLHPYANGPLVLFEVISLLGTALRVSFFHKGGSNWANCNYDHLNNFGQQREREGKTKLGTAVTVLVAWSY